jgi:tetratricopeptide (TPR) repeat protein
VALYREIGDTPGIATMLNNLAINAVLGHADFARALTLYQEALVLQRSVGNRGGEATALLNLGTTFSDKSDYEQAMMPLEASLALFRALNDHGGTAHALQSLGALARHQGHLAQASSLLRESIEMNRRVDSKGLTASTLEEMAALTAAQGEFERAAQLYGRAEALREAIGYPIAPGNHAAYDREVANIQGALSRLAFAAAWAAGRSLPLDEALSFL